LNRHTTDQTARIAAFKVVDYFIETHATWRTMQPQGLVEAPV